MLLAGRADSRPRFSRSAAGIQIVKFEVTGGEGATPLYCVARGPVVATLRGQLEEGTEVLVIGHLEGDAMTGAFTSSNVVVNDIQCIPAR